jgi:RHS repeat-associated protein
VPHLPAPLSYDSGTYLYDGSGNIKAINTDRYVYDAAGRLTYGAASRHSGLGQTYTYDAFGNMTSIDGGSGPSTFGVDPSTNRISLHTNPSTGAGYNTYADYDAAGNITSISGSVASAYDAAGMMSQFRGGSYYLYTADDERIATRSSDGTLYSWTLRDPSEKVLREYSETVANSGGVFTSTWIWKRDYVYRDGVLFAAVTPSGSSEVKQHYHVDHLGTPRLITDSAGVQKYAYDYYAFGKDAAFNTGDPEALHFTGHERDYESGTAAPNTDYLDYMHARYYSSNLGRFLSVDPSIDLKKTLPNPQMWNRYAYVVNNPLRYTDPDGRLGNDGLTKPMTAENLCCAPPEVAWAFHAEGALLAMAGGGAAAETAIGRGAMSLATSAYLDTRLALTALTILASFTDQPTLSEFRGVVAPNGVKIGTEGTSTGIRFVQGGFAEAKAMFQSLAKGGTIAHLSKDALTVELKGLGTVTLRTVSATEGVKATIQFAIKGLGVREIKYVPK